MAAAAADAAALAAARADLEETSKEDASELGCTGKDLKETKAPKLSKARQREEVRCLSSSPKTGSQSCGSHRDNDPDPDPDPDPSVESKVFIFRHQLPGLP